MGQYFTAVAAYGYDIGWGENLGPRFHELRDEDLEIEEAVGRILGEAGIDMAEHGLGTAWVGNSFTGNGFTLLTSKYIEAFLPEAFDAEDKGVGAGVLPGAMMALGAPQDVIAAGPSWILGGWIY